MRGQQRPDDSPGAAATATRLGPDRALPDRTQEDRMTDDRERWALILGASSGTARGRA